MEVLSNWYETFFQGISLDLWRKAVSPEQTQDEANFLIKTLECAPDTRLLDVPCGNGRHSLELAKRGYQMTGMDISEQFIEEARVSSSAAGEKIEWVLSDMRHIEGEESFDGAFCVGNSFSYLDYSGMQEFLSGVFQALKSGARFIVETGVVAEAILPNLKERIWYQVDDILFAIEHRYQADVSCLDTYYTFVRDGKVETKGAKYWIYTAGEIGRMLGGVGLEVEAMYSSLEYQPFTLGSQRLYVVARKHK